ncbi:poly(3-hydroxybutyrate) depolymerase [Bradyrhizobium sp. F1.13.4]
MRLSRSHLVVTSFLVLVAVAVCLFFPLDRPFAQIVKTPPLAAYGTDLQQTSVSGVSAGAGMALQIHVAHSSIMRGVGIIAGVAYNCADSRLPSVFARVARGLKCIDGGPLFGGADGATFAGDRTADAAQVSGAIDDPAVNLPRQKIWLFSGYNDGEVRRAAMDSVAEYYAKYVPTANIFYKTNNRAPHAIVTDNYGEPCLALNPGFINNCQYDAAGRLLEHIYGHLNPRSTAQTGALLAFDQSEFTGAKTSGEISLADTGYVYVPTACQPSTQPSTKASICRVHVVFHGCLQYAGLVGDAVTRHAGYNEWADTNQIIVLYPQTIKMDILNPKGCPDWWGLSDQLPLNADFARKTGYQIKAFRGDARSPCAEFLAAIGIGHLRDAAGLRGAGQYGEVDRTGLEAQQRRYRFQYLSIIQQHWPFHQSEQHTGARRELRGSVALGEHDLLLPGQGSWSDCKREPPVHYLAGGDNGSAGRM